MAERLSNKSKTASMADTQCVILLGYDGKSHYACKTRKWLLTNTWPTFHGSDTVDPSTSVLSTVGDGKFIHEGNGEIILAKTSSPTRGANQQPAGHELGEFVGVDRHHRAQTLGGLSPRRSRLGAYSSTLVHPEHGLLAG